MPIQAHALAWASLAGLFEYKPLNHGIPGDQRPDLYPRGHEKQAQVIRHFADTFKDVLQEHTRILRAKLKTPEQYKERASIWQHSDLNLVNAADHAAETSAELCPEDETWVVVNETPQERSNQAVEDSRALRQRVCQMESGWESDQETRAIFPNEFNAMYQPYRKLGNIAEFQTLETWSNTENVPSLRDPGDWSSRAMTVWFNERTRADILKLLIIDITRHEDSWGRTADIDRLMLLRHHPQVNFNQHMWVPLQCCYIPGGFNGLINAALQFLLYFGILEIMVNHGETRFQSPSRDRPGMQNYMTFPSLRRAITNLTSEHEYLAETIPFRMSWETRLYPDDDWYLRKTLVTDLLSDRARLHAMYKLQWKTLVLAKLLVSEDGGGDDFPLETRIFDQLDVVFRANLLDRPGLGS